MDQHEPIHCSHVDASGRLVRKDIRECHVAIYGHTRVAESVVIGSFVVLGYPKEARLVDSAAAPEPDAVQVGDRCMIGNQVTVTEGTVLETDVILEDHVRIGFNCTIGRGTRVMYGAFVCDRVRVGRNAKIAGFVCDAATIGDDSTVMGNLVHSYSSPHVAWGVDEPSPVIGDRCVVGYGATIVGGITIGHNSFIAAGSVVTRDVPPTSIVTGTNRVVPAALWKGRQLSDEFWNWEGSR